MLTNLFPTLIAISHLIAFGSNFLKGLAGPFMAGKPVQGVNSNTFASRVDRLTQPADAQPAAAKLNQLPLVTKPNGGYKPITPVKVYRLQFFLADYPKNLSSYLINGFSFGFSIQFYGERRPSVSPNLKSALESPQIVSLKLQKELEAGRYCGTFCTPPIQKLSVFTPWHHSEKSSL